MPHVARFVSIVPPATAARTAPIHRGQAPDRVCHMADRVNPNDHRRAAVSRPNHFATRARFARRHDASAKAREAAAIRPAKFHASGRDRRGRPGDGAAKMRAVAVDPTASMVTVAKRAHNVETASALTPDGVYSPGGRCSGRRRRPHAGGAWGFSCRQLGMTCDNLLATEVVTASGQIVTEAARDNADSTIRSAFRSRSEGQMATFLLIHGGWHGAWCWERLTPALRRAGHRVVAPDLPGHGADETPPSPELPARYAPFVADLLRAQAEPVILVGHSSGGMVASAAAEIAPDRVAALVYLAAFLLPPGATPRDAIRPDDGSLLREAMLVDLAAGVTIIRPEAAPAVFYADCPPDLAAWAAGRLQPEPIVPSAGPASAANAPLLAAPAIPRYYVETLADQALPLPAQRRMTAAMPCRAVFSLPASHSPFLSMPDETAAILDRIAADLSRETKH
jgi:pimeloyl-ACP methyl ester carboxylesterase